MNLSLICTCGKMEGHQKLKAYYKKYSYNETKKIVFDNCSKLNKDYKFLSTNNSYSKFDIFVNLLVNLKQCLDVNASFNNCWLIM